MRQLFEISDEIKKYEKIIIYGAVIAGKGVLLKLLQRNIKVLCFADADTEKCGAKHLNIPIVHIDELSGMIENAAIIVAGAYAFYVAGELKKRGFKNIFLDYGNEANIIHMEREHSLSSI